MVLVSANIMVMSHTLVIQFLSLGVFCVFGSFYLARQARHLNFKKKNQLHQDANEEMILGRCQTWEQFNTNKAEHCGDVWSWVS